MVTGIPIEASDPRESAGVLALPAVENRPPAAVERPVSDDLLLLLSHELRSPLAYISTSSELIAQGNLTPEETADLLDHIKRHSDYLASLIERVLDAEQLGWGIRAALSERVDAREVVEAARDLHAEQDDAQRIRIACEPNVPVARGDRIRSTIVVSNLISNALKYSPPGSLIHIDVGVDGAGRIAIAVTNQGHGIPPEQMSALFDRFRQVSAPPNEQRLGHGLGLFICRELAEAQGGTLAVQSEIGQGATFTFSLPPYCPRPE